MKGLYNGASMKLIYLSPKKFNAQLHNLSKKAEQRLSWIDWYYAHDKNARLTCRHFAISPSVFYRWLNRFEKGNKQFTTLENKSTRPKNTRSPTTKKETINLIVKIRKTNPAWSKYKIAKILKRDHNINISPSTVGRTLKRKNLINPKQYGYKRKSSAKRNYKIPRKRAHKSLRNAFPGSLIQVDTKRLPVLGTTYFQFTAVDCFTRLQFIDVYSTITSSAGENFLKSMIEYFPFELDLQSDNGSEFLKHFHKLCDQKNIQHYFTYPHCPKQNGRVERLNQTAAYEFWDYQPDLIPQLDLLKKKAEIWNYKYNTYRPHESLDYETPYSFYLNWLADNNQNVSPESQKLIECNKFQSVLNV